MGQVGLRRPPQNFRDGILRPVVLGDLHGRPRPVRRVVAHAEGFRAGLRREPEDGGRRLAPRAPAQDRPSVRAAGPRQEDGVGVGVIAAVAPDQSLDELGRGSSGRPAGQNLVKAIIARRLIFAKNLSADGFFQCFLRGGRIVDGAAVVVGLRLRGG